MWIPACQLTGQKKQTVCCEIWTSHGYYWFCNVSTCCQLKKRQCFGENFCFNLQETGRNNFQTSVPNSTPQNITSKKAGVRWSFSYVIIYLRPQPQELQLWLTPRFCHMYTVNVTFNKLRKFESLMNRTYGNDNKNNSTFMAIGIIVILYNI